MALIMALGDWLLPNNLTRKQNLKADLQSIDARLAALESGGGRPAFYATVGVPDTTLGKDGDIAFDKASGSMFEKQTGAWAKIGEGWLDDTTT